MKKYFLGFFLFLMSFAPMFMRAQNTDFFEGTIEYSVEVKGSESQMLLENEPNTKMQMHVKDNNYIVKLQGGRYPKTFIFVADSNYEYSIDMKEMRAFRSSAYNNKGMVPMYKRTPAKSTEKQETINGIECTIYKAVHDSAYFTFWVSDKYRVNRELYKGKGRAQASFLVPGLNGMIPIKMVKVDKGLTMTLVMKSIKAEKFPKEQFLIPKEFTVKKRDFRF